MESNAFKIEKIEMVNKTFRMPLNLLQELQKVAKDQGVSVNKLVIKCCEYALNNIEK